MITENELLDIKTRMLKCAGVTESVIGSAETVYYEEDTYAEVAASLAMLRDDMSRIFAEIDTLRLLVRREFAPIFAARKPLALTLGKAEIAAPATEPASVEVEVGRGKTVVKATAMEAAEAPKKKRGRPAKVKPAEVEVVAEQPKRGRGRPKKVSPELAAALNRMSKIGN